MTLQSKWKTICLRRLILTSILLMASSVSAAAQTNTFPSSGNAGIGTMTPTEPLEINKNQNAGTALAVDNGYTSAGNAAYSGFWFRQSGANRFFFGSVNDGNTTQTGGPGAAQLWSFANGPMLFATNNSERMRITSSGNVGIGITSPATKFQVNYDNDSTTFVNGTDFTLLLRNNNTTTNNWVGFGFAGNRVDGTSRLAGAVGAQMTSHANGSFATDLVFSLTGAGESPVEVLRMKSNGNVGIGTTSPNQRLSVAGMGAFYNSTPVTPSGVRGLFMGNFSVGSSIWSYDYASGVGDALFVSAQDINLSTYVGGNGINRLYISNSGNVGVGTTTPSYKLDVNGEINATGIRINGTPISGGGGTSPWLGAGPIYYNGGNVGIGTASPFDTLHIYSTSNASRGMNIDAQGTGNAQQAAINFVTLGDGTKSVLAAGTKGWHFTARGNGFINSGEQNDLQLYSWNDTSTVTNIQTWDYATGNVGIGTTNPTAGKLQIQKAAGVGLALLSGSTSAGQHTSMQIGRTSADGSLGVASQAGEYATDAVAGDIILRTESSSNKLILNSGTGGATLVVNNSNVGIGTTSPAEKLEINGNLKLSGTGNINAAGTIEAGNIKAKYQDLAEWVPSSEQLSAGTVVVLDTSKSNQVVSATVAYDTRVAGVISAQPGITLGEGGEGKVLVATTGRVRVKVDASRGAIQIGDLLVTSDVSGVAMKSEPVEFAGRKMHMPGTIIGKALEPLAKGSGEILVLLSLQ